MFFSVTLPQGLFTSFASADNSLSGGSKYHHKALPLLLSEALLRSGSIRSPLPTEVAVAPFTFPFPSAAVVVTEALSGVSASVLTKNTRGPKSLVHSQCTAFDYVYIRSTCPLSIMRTEWERTENNTGENMKIHEEVSQPLPV